MTYQQIPLNLQLRAEATFDNFVDVGNETLLHTLRVSEEHYVFLWGDNACGKTHLLQALCHHAWQQQQSAVYIPLADDEINEPEILIGLETMALICIDDIHLIAGHPEWETAMFNLFNAVRDQGGRMLISSRHAPNMTSIKLADLVSRLNWGAVFQILSLQDGDKITVLQSRAEQLGLSLSQDVAEYLLKHSPRDMASLFSLLNKLNTASLAEQRRLTIPFVRQYL